MRLRKSEEFRVVYASGRRLDGRLMSVFLLPNGLAEHRLGITASRKVSKRAVDRNRLKRLLRETFRQSGGVLNLLGEKYDWVLNPRRALLERKLSAPLAEFQELVGRVEGTKRDAAVGSEVVPAAPVVSVESVEGERQKP